LVKWCFSDTDRIIKNYLDKLRLQRDKNNATIMYPDIRVKHCAYGHSVATLLNPRGVTTVSHKYSLTVAR
jgi:hypothetical protein